MNEISTQTWQSTAVIKPPLGYKKKFRNWILLGIYYLHWILTLNNVLQPNVLSFADRAQNILPSLDIDSEYNII